MIKTSKIIANFKIIFKIKKYLEIKTLKNDKKSKKIIKN